MAAPEGRGTYILSWSQTEADGTACPDPGQIVTGAHWRWFGEALRVDTPQGRLILEGAEGRADLHRRAARMVRRLVGAALAEDPARIDRPDADDRPDAGFTLTDGRREYAATLIPVPEKGARLLMFLGPPPPAGADLWVVRGLPGVAPQRQDGGVICFASGTMIATPLGPRRIETLRQGDLVDTADNGPQPVLWTGARRMSGARLYAMPHLRPIRVQAQALGPGEPEGELLVSPEHRLLVRGARARALFGTPEILVQARHLVDDRTVTVDVALREVTYVHVLLEAHQIIRANGIQTESFHPLSADFETIEDDQKHSLLRLVPGADVRPEIYGDFARRIVSPSEAAILRHAAA